MDTEIELLVAGSNGHLGVGTGVVSHARREHNVAVVFETSNQPQILHSTPNTLDTQYIVLG